VSSHGTIVKVDTRTGEVLGEYRTAPEGQPLNPSRTTVDHDGNVWVGNRDGNSVTKVGLLENNQCVDRDSNGVITTSTGLGDVLAWSDTGGVDTDGGVSMAEDECIRCYTRTTAPNTRHVSVDGNNDVWVSGWSNGPTGPYDLIDGETGEIKRTEPNPPGGFGGYGGLVDGNGVLWRLWRLWRTGRRERRSVVGQEAHAMGSPIPAFWTQRRELDRV
jgi:hypothetical protein